MKKDDRGASAMKPLIGVSLAVHNSLDQTRECLLALCKSEGVNLNIVVIDDGSNDGTHEMLRVEFPTIDVITGDGGLWWAGSTNLGIQQCLDAGCDYIILLNPDVRVENSTLLELYKVSKQFGEAIVAPVVLDKNDPTKVWEAGHRWERAFRWFPLFWVSRYQYRHGTDRELIPVEPYETDSVVGRGGLITRKAIEKIGLLDSEKMPQYGADGDMALRAKRNDIPMYIAPKATVHLDVKNTGHSIPEDFIAAVRGFFLYLISRKHGEAIRVLYYWNRNNLPIYVALPNYVFMLSLNSIRYWQRYLTRRFCR